MKTVKIVIVILLLVSLIAGAYLLYNHLAPMMNSSTPQSNAAASEDRPTPPAPDVVFYDADGELHTLSEFRGKPVIMNFWATWCGYCKMEMPYFENKFREYGDEIHFVMINMTDGVRETVDKAAKYLEEEGYTFPSYYDTRQDAATKYPVMGLPVSYFIDAEGNVVAAQNGALSEQMLQMGVDLLLKGE